METTIRQRLDNVIAATPQEIRARFRRAAADVVGDKRALHLEELVDDCGVPSDGRVIAAQCRQSRWNGCYGRRHDQQ